MAQRMDFFLTYDFAVILVVLPIQRLMLMAGQPITNNRSIETLNLTNKLVFVVVSKLCD